MTNTLQQRPRPPQCSRRTLLRAGAVGTGTALAGSFGSTYGTRRARAIPPIILVGAAAAAGGVAVGWMLRDWDPLNSEDVPKGITKSALQQQIYETARTRRSTNQSTITDNRNIVETGLKHAAYGDGKVAAIEAINDEDTQAEVTEAAKTAVDDYQTKVVSNFLKSWNEAVTELGKLVGAIEEASELSLADVTSWSLTGDENHTFQTLATSERSITLADETSFTVKRVQVLTTDFNDETRTFAWDPLKDDSTTTDSFNNQYSVDPVVTVTPGDLGEVAYMGYSSWSEIANLMQTTFENVRSGLTRWVDKVYSQIQEGELETEDLLTPRELANLTADREQFNQAVADLLALNIPVDLEREAEIRLENVNATVFGALAVTSQPEGGITAGETIDPANREEDYYLTYDVSEGQGSWSAYEEGVDGGIITFTQEPLPRLLYRIQTVAGETAEVTTDQFTKQENSEQWTVDVSDQLEKPITSIESVEFFAQTEETTYRTVQLREPFTVVTFRNSEGEEVEQASFTQTTPQTDENYITEQEWQEMRDRQEQLIEKYDQSKNQGGFGFTLPGLDSGLNTSIAGVLVIGGIGLAIWNQLTNTA